MQHRALEMLISTKKGLSWLD